MLPLLNIADSQAQNGKMKNLSQMLSKEVAEQGYGVNGDKVQAIISNFLDDYTIKVNRDNCFYGILHVE